MTQASPRLLTRPVSLAMWAAMLAMQPRAWLPENLHPVVSPREIILGTGLTGLMCSAMVLWTMGLREGLAFWIVLLVCVALILWAMQAQLRTRHVRRGWEVDFQQGCLTPVGLSDQQTIRINPAEYSLGCYPARQSDTVAAYQLELRHVRRGPVAPLTLVHLRSRQFQKNLRILDRCVDTLAERLQIRRSGAPLLVRKTATAAD